MKLYDISKLRFIHISFFLYSPYQFQSLDQNITSVLWNCRSGADMKAVYCNFHFIYKQIRDTREWKKCFIETFRNSIKYFPEKNIPWNTSICFLALKMKFWTILAFWITILNNIWKNTLDEIACFFICRCNTEDTKHHKLSFADF